MDTVTIKGIEYKKASVVAKKLKYTSDYVGQLCRSKKVKAKLVGRTWYVNLDSILEYKESRYNAENENQPSVKKVEKKTLTKAKNKSSDDKVKITFDNPQANSRLKVDPPIKANTVKIFRPNESYSNREITKLKVKSNGITYENDKADLLPKIIKRPVSRFDQNINTKETKHALHLSLLKEKPDFEKKEKDNSRNQPEAKPFVLPIKSTKKPTKLTSAGLPTVYLKGKISVSSAENKFEVEDEEKKSEIKISPKEVEKNKLALERIIAPEQSLISKELRDTKIEETEYNSNNSNLEDNSPEYDYDEHLIGNNNSKSRNLKVISLEEDDVEEEQEEQFDLKSLAYDYQKKLAKENSEFVSVSVSTLKPKSVQVAQQVESKIMILRVVSWSLIAVLALVLLLSLFIETEVSTSDALKASTKFIFSLPKF